jgi:hypothetical protein
VTVGWRSTTLRLAEEHCGKALDYADANAPYDRRPFATGTAAHAILEDLGKAAASAGRYLEPEESHEIARETCLRLISVGRDFEGEVEPPLPPAKVWQGRDLALAYHDYMPMDPGSRYEEGLAVTRDWLPCPYDKGAWLRVKIDKVGTEVTQWYDMEDEGGGPRLVVADFKSGWQDDGRALNSTQRKIQAVLSWDRWGEGHEMLKLVVVNFRMREEFSLIVQPRTPEGEAVMARWRRDIETEIRAWSGPRIASPGPQCFGCPYLLGSCEAAQQYLSRTYGSADPEDLARAYAVYDAAKDALKEPLREATADGPLEVDRALVGTLPQEERTLTADAPEKLAAAWNRRARDASAETDASRAPGLLKALKIGVAQAEALAGHLYPRNGGEESFATKARLLGSVVTKRVTRRFGVHRAVDSEAAEM